VQHLVSLISVEDDATGEELEVVWEIEPGTSVIERGDRRGPRGRSSRAGRGPRRRALGGDERRSARVAGAVPERHHDRGLSAGAVGAGAADAADDAADADDVGLGKTIEAGLVVQELLLRHRARTAIVVCPASLQLQWRDEMREKFGLEFPIVDMLPLPCGPLTRLSRRSAAVCGCALS
jgi:hypothetical protein